MRILKTVELADFAEKNAKRIRILKTVELADFAEKSPKRMRILNERESWSAFVRQHEMEAITIRERRR